MNANTSNIENTEELTDNEQQQLKLSGVGEENGEEDANNEESKVKSGRAKSKTEDKGVTLDQVSSLMKSMFADFATQQQKAQTEAQKLKSMDATQKLQYECDKAKSELDQLREQMANQEMQAETRKLLKANGYNVPDGIVARLCANDAEQTKANVEEFSTMLSEMVENEVKARLKQSAPKTGVTGDTMTKEQIFAEKNPQKQIDLIRSHPELFQ